MMHKRRRILTFGLAHTNPNVGDFTGNAAQILDMMPQMAKAKVSIGLFPECALTGYSAEDMLRNPDFHNNQLPHLQQLIRCSGLMNTQVGHIQTLYLVGGTFTFHGHAFNVAYVFGRGKLWGIIPKENLPEYGIFHDARQLDEGDPGRGYYIDIPEMELRNVPFGDFVFDVDGICVGVSVCEDIWVPEVISRHARSHALVECNISASPFRSGIPNTRREMIRTRSADEEMIVAYTSLIGGQGGIVYDGDGIVCANGRPLFESSRWKQGWEKVSVSLDAAQSRRSANTTWRRRVNAAQHLPQSSHIPVQMVLTSASTLPKTSHPFLPSDPVQREAYFDDLIEAMLLGIGDFLDKTKTPTGEPIFYGLGINLSGGVDSELVAIIATLCARRRFAHLPAAEQASAVRSFVHCFSLPTKFNSRTTKSIAVESARELGISLHEHSIQELTDREMQFLRSMHEPGWEPPRLTKQGAQAELRAHIQSMESGARRLCMLNTSNMTEKAMGYGNKRGDMLGDLAVISNLPKTVIYPLLEHIAKKYSIRFIRKLLKTKASAELERNQSDEQDLMPFVVIDTLIKLHVGDSLGPVESYFCVRETFSDKELRAIRRDYQPELLREWVKTFFVRFYSNIHKWVTSPEGIHLGAIDLDRERALHMPTKSSLDWLNLHEVDDLPTQELAA